MVHQTVTPDPEDSMPRHTHLMRRNSRYYLNVKVPKDLREVMGKELIRKSLGTSDPREAARRVRFESLKLDALFDAEREKLNAEKTKAASLRKRTEFSDRELHNIVSRFFVAIEQDSENWWQTKGRKLRDDELDEVRDTFETDLTVCKGGSPQYMEHDGDASNSVAGFLEEEGLEIPRDSSAFKKLAALFRQAKVENLRRSIDRLSRGSAKAHDAVFRELFAHTPVSRIQRVTLSELTERYLKALTGAKRAGSTLTTYRLPCRILCEFLGGDTLLEDIKKDDVERLLGLLQRIPSNATKRYRGLTLEQAVAAADKDEDSDRLEPKTLSNYFNNISAIFNFAVEKRLMLENPVKDRWLRATFIGDDDEEDPTHYTVEELNRLFRAPLYTGCVDDKRGYAKPGSNVIRRGRFWVPLIALFHGLRCNEAAQLYTEDVCEADGIPYFEIRETRADKSKCDKLLKSKQSARKVPIHPELIKIGFLEYLEERRADLSHPRLFPDLKCGHNGYFSNPFSKWFCRFKQRTLSEECKATFHSFRHHFRSALGELGVPISDVEMLGGWELVKRSSERRYDQPTIQRLFAHVRRVEYPGLDLSHLYTAIPVRTVQPTRRCRRSIELD